MRGKGEGAIYRVPADRTKPLRYWTAAVELPPRDGQRRRKVLRSKDKNEVIRKLAETKQNLQAHGDLPTASQTLESWLTVWFESIAVKKIRPKTAQTYQTLIRHHINPTIGSVRLDRLTPAHVRRMTAAITEKGLSSTTAMQAHRILAVALKAALREGRVTRNAAALTDAPRKAAPNLERLTAEQGIAVLRTAADDPLGSLWAAVLLTGARQGELLGLEAERVQQVAGRHGVSYVLDLSWQLQRIPWEHGCDGCGRARGSDCPKRKITVPADFEKRHITGGLWWTRPKSKAGWRVIPLVDPLASIILRQVEVARSTPNPYGLLWTMPDGSPIDPRVESEAWHALLKRAGVPDVRLHDGRHTTVDLLYEAGVPEAVIMEIVGQSVVSVTRGYRARGNLPQLTEAMRALSAHVESVRESLATEP